MKSIIKARETVDKDLSVIFNIKALAKRTNKKPARITFEFAYPPHLRCCTKLADDLMTKLLSQLIGGDIQIKNLRLSWFEDLPE